MATGRIDAREYKLEVNLSRDCSLNVGSADQGQLIITLKHAFGLQATLILQDMDGIEVAVLGMGSSVSMDVRGANGSMVHITPPKPLKTLQIAFSLELIKHAAA